MFFRPEEVHSASRVGWVYQPPREGEGHITDQPFRISRLNLAVLYLDLDGFTAIETYGIDLHRLTGKEPADRQRFESSLGKPLLLPVDRNSVLSWEIVERGQGDYGVDLGIKPAGETASLEKLAEGLTAFPGRNAQLGCNLRVVWRLPRLNEPFQNDTVSLVLQRWFSQSTLLPSKRTGEIPLIICNGLTYLVTK